MKSTFTRHLSRLAGALALAAALIPAAAAPVQQSLTLTADFGSAGPFSGTFSYDDAKVPASGEFLLTLTGFAIDLGGSPYDLSDTGDAFAVFRDGQFRGLQLTIDQVLTLSPAIGASEASFAYSNGRSEAMGSASFAVVDGGTVPEPATAALALGALGLAAALRRRRRD